MVIGFIYLVHHEVPRFLDMLQQHFVEIAAAQIRGVLEDRCPGLPLSVPLGFIHQPQPLAMFVL
jgi:hypothetical protein